MPVSFKTYGYERGNNDQSILELKKVSLCFLNAEEIYAFSVFVRECAEGAKANQNWDHEHYMTKDGQHDISLGILDQRNY